MTRFALAPSNFPDDALAFPFPSTHFPFHRASTARSHSFTQAMASSPSSVFHFHLLPSVTLLLLAVASSGSASPLLPLIHLASRATPILNNHTGQPEAYSPITQQLIPQGPATDAGGQNYNGPAILWIIFSFVIGPPMAFAGIRGWRLTTGVGLGLAATVCCKYSLPLS